MCGIIGIAGREPIVDRLITAMEGLEYRGYDSAGIAVCGLDGLDRRRVRGEVSDLKALVGEVPLNGCTGIGHVRWATHGKPTAKNAHPHMTPRVALVHNGIVENNSDLAAELKAEGQRFESETDSETIAQLIDFYLKRGDEPLEATRSALRRLRGAYTVAMLFAQQPDLIVAACGGPPLVVGRSKGTACIGSDAAALAEIADELFFLKEGELVAVRAGMIEITTRNGIPVVRKPIPSTQAGRSSTKGGFRHYMEKEINENPEVLYNQVHDMLPYDGRTRILSAIPMDPSRLERLVISGCGSAANAGMVARYWLESEAQLQTDFDIASELRYRAVRFGPGTVGLLVSQSGETADTLGVLKLMHQRDISVVSVVNVLESTMVRESDGIIHTLAGPEISVASTKAFTAQLCALACLTYTLADARRAAPEGRMKAMRRALESLPDHAAAALALEDAIAPVAAMLAKASQVILIGRGSNAPIAQEGALKLKEVSYLSAEAYAAGELKHGPIAMVDSALPVVALAPFGPCFGKMLSNIQEVAARDGKLVVFTDQHGSTHLQDVRCTKVILPAVDPLIAPIIYAISVHMMAYFVARERGTCIDRPRNLAKSVTVE